MPEKQAYYSALEAIGWIMNPAAPLSPDDVMDSEQAVVFQAHRALLAEAAAGRIGVDGTPGTEDAPQSGGFPQRIPTGVFAVPNIGFSLLGDDTLGLDHLHPEKSVTAILFGPVAERFTGPYYWHVRIVSEDVRKRWPTDLGAAAFRKRMAELAEAPLEIRTDKSMTEIKDAHERHQATLILTGEKGPKAKEPAGFIWADRALRLLAFRDPDCRLPHGMNPIEALAAINAASVRLRDALASAPDDTATGRRIGGGGDALPSSTRGGMRAMEFADPYLCLDLEARLTLDVGQPGLPIEVFAAWLRERPPQWCEVLLLESFVLALAIRESEIGDVELFTQPTQLTRQANAGVSAEPIERRPKYDEKACRAWFELRTKRWPLDAKFPSAEEDLRAAREHFEGRIARDPFRKIRRAKVPDEWQKSGQRRTRG